VTSIMCNISHFFLASAVFSSLVYSINAVSPSVHHPENLGKRALKTSEALKTKKGTESPKGETCSNMPEFSDIFVFGDSLQDQGNLASVSPNIAVGMFNNGKFFTEYVAEKFNIQLEMSNHMIALAMQNIELITGTNYAVVGATASSNADPGRFLIDGPGQVHAFMLANQGKAPSDALYMISFGGNELIDLYRQKFLWNTDKTDEELFQSLKISANSITNIMIRPLLDAGAKHILVSSIPPLQLSPYVSLTTPEESPAFVEEALDTFDSYLKEALKTLECEENANIMYYNEVLDSDVAQKIGLQIESPCTISLNGIPKGNPVIPPLNGKTSGPVIWDPKCDPPNFPEALGFFWWDEFHPTTAVHEFVAKEIINQVCREVGGNSHSKKKKGACKTSKTMKEIKSKKTKSSKGAKNQKVF